MKPGSGGKKKKTGIGTAKVVRRKVKLPKTRQKGY